MPQIVCHIALDVSVNDPGQVIMAKQGDSESRLLCVHFTDCKKELPIEQGAAVLLNAARDTEAFAFEGRVQPDGTALFPLPGELLCRAGSLRCDVSAIGASGGRLTTSPFDIQVVEAVCGLITPSMTDLGAEFLATQMIQTLTPEQEGAGFVLRPAVNRKYALNLSGEQYGLYGSWRAIALELPTPDMPTRENWILIYCHAPAQSVDGPLTLQWGSNCLFADGAEPTIRMEDFDIICNYSPAAGRWQIGVVQYGVGGGMV